MIPDGARVAYIGPQKGGHEIGDQGTVMRAEATYSHVRWSTGRLANDIEMVRNDDLIVNGSLTNHPLTAGDTLDSALVGINVGAVYSKRGSLGLVNALNEEGHLAAFPSIAEDAIQFVAQRIRQDPSVAEVLGRLDEGEADEFVHTACRVVLRDAVEDF